jgi:hypothetical protein
VAILAKSITQSQMNWRYASQSRGDVAAHRAGSTCSSNLAVCKKTGILDRIIHCVHRIELRRRIDAKNPPKEPER